MRIAIIGNHSHSLHDPYDRELKRFVSSFVERLGRHHTVAYFGEKESLNGAHSYNVLTDQEKRERQRLIRAGKEMAALSKLNQAYIRVLKYIDEENYDIVHNISDQLAPLAASSRLKAVLVTTLFKRPDKHRVNFLNANAEDVNSYFCAPNKALKDSWKLAVPRLDIAHIPSGSLPAREETVLDMERPKNKAFWSGDIKKDCGLDLALKACSLAGVGLMFTGHLADEAYYRERVLPLMTKEDRYLGRVENLNMKEVLERVRLGLWTEKRRGPIPVRVLDLMANGAPVVGVDCPALRDHVTNDVGALVKSNDEDMAHAIARVQSLCPVAIQQKTINTYGANETSARYMEIFKFIKALQDESKKQQAYRHLCSSSWKGTLGQS